MDNMLIEGTKMMCMF